MMAGTAFTLTPTLSPIKTYFIEGSAREAAGGLMRTDFVIASVAWQSRFVPTAVMALGRLSPFNFTASVASGNARRPYVDPQELGWRLKGEGVLCVLTLSLRA